MMEVHRFLRLHLLDIRCSELYLLSRSFLLFLDLCQLSSQNRTSQKFGCDGNSCKWFLFYVSANILYVMCDVGLHPRPVYSCSCAKSKSLSWPRCPMLLRRSFINMSPWPDHLLCFQLCGTANHLSPSVSSIRAAIVSQLLVPIVLLVTKECFHPVLAG